MIKNNNQAYGIIYIQYIQDISITIHFHNFYKIYVSQLDNSTCFCPSFFSWNQPKWAEYEKQHIQNITEIQMLHVIWDCLLGPGVSWPSFKLNSGCGCSWSEEPILKSHSMFHLNVWFLSNELQICVLNQSRSTVSKSFQIQFLK